MQVVHPAQGPPKFSVLHATDKDIHPAPNRILQTSTCRTMQEVSLKRTNIILSHAPGLVSGLRSVDVYKRLRRLCSVRRVHQRRPRSPSILQLQEFAYTRYRSRGITQFSGHACILPACSSTQYREAPRRLPGRHFSQTMNFDCVNAQ